MTSPTLNVVPTEPSTRTGEQQILGLLDELRAMPRTALLLEDVSARSDKLTKIGELLDRMQRFVRNDGERTAHTHLRGLWRQENTRVEQALSRPVVAAAALGTLEAQWLREHPGRELEQRPHLVLVLTHLASLSVRTALKAFVVDEGPLLNTHKPTPYWLLIAPRWFASSLPSTFDGRDLGLTGAAAALTTQLPLEGFTDLEIHTLTALWTPDVHADLFHLPALLDAVEALRHLDHATDHVTDHVTSY